MILQDLVIPERIKQNEVLLRRLIKEHRKRLEIHEDQAKRMAGYKGEKNLAYHLTFLPKEYDIIHGLRLINEQGYAFQIDTLLLSLDLILILEVKNILGTLFFDKNSNQCLRTHNQIEEGFPNPLVQAARHHIQLKNWFQACKLPFPPIEHLVIISFPSTVIKSNDPNTFQKVLHAEHLPQKIKSYKNNIQIEKKDYRRMTKTLLKGHTPLRQDILKVYGIDPSEILTGVQCPECSFLPLQYLHGFWKCPSCQLSSKTAHEKTIDDYFYVMSSTITNKQCREFLHLRSRHVSNELLQKINLTQSGATRGSHYHR